ncbi:MAG: FHA domain-containing protein [Gemmatimonas sp.]|nr:FHA domain-containing protein [Gemmatimonas sp.]
MIVVQWARSRCAVPCGVAEDDAGPGSQETEARVRRGRPLLIAGTEAERASETSGEPRPVRPPLRAGSSTAHGEDSENVRIDTNGADRIQFLPGRLEVVKGAEVGREFRFVRVLGQEVPEITVGRAHGPTHMHVQIPVPTVSRVHARLRFHEQCWCIANLSATNPVRINGRALASPEEATVLVDGDRIELGEVELRYRVGRP